MKKLLFIAVIASAILSFSSCEKTKEEQLKDMIEARLDSTMNNPDSYEFVSMTPIDSIMSKWTEEMESFLLEQKIKSLESKNKRLYAQSDMKYLYSHKERIAFLDSVGINNNKQDSLLKVYKSKMDSYIPKLKGYSTIFKFRGENAFGAIVLNAYKVTFNKELTEIKSIELIE